MKALAAWWLVALVWGTSWLFIKIGLEDLPPFGFGAARSAIALAALVALLIAIRRPPPREPAAWALMAASGLLVFGVNYGLSFWGAQFIPSGLTAVLHATIPAFGLALANIHLPDERLTLPRFGAVALGIAGVAIIFSDQLRIAGWAAVLGCAAIVTGALAVAYANVLVKRFGAAIDPIALMAGQMLCGLAPLAALGFMVEGSPLSFPWTGRAVWSLLYLSLIGSAAAGSLFYWLIREMPVTKVMMIPLVTPLFAVLLGAAVLGEQLLLRTLAGGALILASVALALRRRAPARPVGIAPPGMPGGTR
jgi:drug/metabolite transporter (DMT)-like permease